MLASEQEGESPPLGQDLIEQLTTKPRQPTKVDRATIRNSIIMGGVLIASNLLALTLSQIYVGNDVASYQAFENPQSVVNPLIYIVLILVFTGVILLLAKFLSWMVRVLILGAVTISIIYVLFMPLVVGIAGVSGGSQLDDWILLTSLGISVTMALTALLALIFWPEWYVINIVGFVVAAGTTGIFGISFGILPVILLMVILLIYDYIAVHKTKHMVALADVVTEQRLPVLMVYPTEAGFSYRKPRKGSFSKSKKKRDAMFIGLGDLIIPGVLAVSALTFLPIHSSLGTTGPFLVALGTLLGILVGYVFLIRSVFGGKPQPGLPLLNSGAILGYALTYLIVYQNLSLGLVWPF